MRKATPFHSLYIHDLSIALIPYKQYYLMIEVGVHKGGADAWRSKGVCALVHFYITFTTSMKISTLLLKFYET